MCIRDSYKGMIHQPDPTKDEDMLEGLIHVRHLHTRAIEETKLTCADEMLYPENYRYLFDLLSYNAVGARSVEDLSLIHISITEADAESLNDSMLTLCEVLSAAVDSIASNAE